MTQFVKGKSGNPSGRPKVVAEVEALARQHTTTALKTLVEIARNPKAHSSARVSAASVLLDRGYGKPRQDMRVQHVDEFDGLSDEELRALVRNRPATKRRKGKGEPVAPESPADTVH